MQSKPTGPLTGLIDLLNDEEEDVWNPLDEIMGCVGVKRKKSDKARGEKPWVPNDMDPVLEELPKWSLLTEVLKEIEDQVVRQESFGNFGPNSMSLIIDRRFVD